MICTGMCGNGVPIGMTSIITNILLQQTQLDLPLQVVWGYFGAVHGIKDLTSAEPRTVAATYHRLHTTILGFVCWLRIK